MSNYLLKLAQHVAAVEKLRDGEMLDSDGNVVRSGDFIKLVAYGWDVPKDACDCGTAYRVLRISGGGQAIVPYPTRGSGVMRVRSECMRRVTGQ